MPDFSIDYTALHTAQEKMRSLADTAEDGGATGEFKALGDATTGEARAVLGDAGLANAFHSFFRYSRMRTKEAEDGLRELAEVFGSVSNVFFDADAQLSSSAGLMGSSIGLKDWLDQRKAWDAWQTSMAEWNAYLEEIGAKEYFDAHPDADIGEVCRADGAPEWCRTWEEDDDAPYQPGEPPPRPADDPPTEYVHTDENGTTRVTLELDDDYNVMREVSEITTADGQTFRSETVYGTPPQIVTPENGEPFDARDYTMTTTYADGTESVTTVVINEDGSGTMTEKSGDETTVYTRSGPGAEWQKTEE
ncbi:serine/arginine repetitive matrix protein 2 [Streptomyces sp. YIM 98790]|uniref:serine/arginine repetitive matrix protein 2 n=1 Tax=Streptomyces sp. YIM 98790 TaxID=2689077 RepID=UPI001407B830|nr:serine/arginine repetitive matrix protein 2 [Streptomyces sp. YIM 98790]